VELVEGVAVGIGDHSTKRAVEGEVAGLPWGVLLTEGIAFWWLLERYPIDFSVKLC
jgi:hypothetical protein